MEAIEPGKNRLGWIGTGVMGASMCGHLVAKGFEMTVYSRTRRKDRVARRPGGAMGGLAIGRGPTK